MTTAKYKLGLKSKKILDAIPFNMGITASEIFDKTGISSKTVGQLISNQLINSHVTKKKIIDKKWAYGSIYEYKRIVHVSKNLI